MNKTRKLIHSENTSGNGFENNLEDKISELNRKVAESFIECNKTNFAMFYGCKDCGAQFLIWLERGLEEHNGECHKPVPFAIQCPKCNGFHCNHIDWNNDIHLHHEIKIPNRSLYFANVRNRDCGILKEAI